MLYGDVSFLNVSVQQLQQLLHDPSVHHVNTIPICAKTKDTFTTMNDNDRMKVFIVLCSAGVSLPFRAKLAMARAPASCNWWL